MGNTLETWYGKKVTVTMRHWLTPPMTAVLQGCEAGFVLLEVEKKGKKEELLVPLSAVLHLRQEAGAS